MRGMARELSAIETTAASGERARHASSVGCSVSVNRPGGCCASAGVNLRAHKVRVTRTRSRADRVTRAFGSRGRVRAISSLTLSSDVPMLHYPALLRSRRARHIDGEHNVVGLRGRARVPTELRRRSAREVGFERFRP